MIDFYLGGFDPPLDGEADYYECTVLEHPSVSANELVVRIKPEVVVEGSACDELLLRTRSSTYLWYVDDQGRGSVDLGSTDGATVYVSCIQAEAFGLRLSSIKLQLPEPWRRGGYWSWFLDAMSSYVDREGHSSVPSDHLEDGFPLGKYVRKLRSERVHGTLSNERIDLLERMPGWEWGGVI